jgi:hypothetical protein
MILKIFNTGKTQAALELRAKPQLHFLRTGLWSQSNDIYLQRQRCKFLQRRG